MRGAADDSYGIEVAQLAGLPQSVIKRAKEVLSSLETENRAPRAAKDPNELDMVSFDDVIQNDVIHKLKMTDMESLTPLEALIFLSELKKMLNG